MGRLTHTPGPWKPVARLLNPLDDSIGWAVEAPTGGIGGVLFPDEADARLAAASPGMYEALLDIQSYSDDPAGEVEAVLQIKRMATATLVKVEGGETAGREIDEPKCQQCRI